MTAFDDWRARSPYYDETHEALAQSRRRFVTREIAPHIDRWEAEGELPRALVAGSAESVATPPIDGARFAADLAADPMATEKLATGIEAFAKDLESLRARIRAEL